ncbi:hypothetical protein [Piscinibacter sp.]|uniref:hypothetical protein n=1 Tax=Piscinibacter sp. TaxID=1903157 RepID=UPI0039E6AFE6
MNLAPARLFKAAAPSLVALAVLAACGGGVDHEDDDHGPGHESYSVDTAGRVAIAEKDAKALRLHDLDSGTIEATHQLDNAPSALYASPGGRYVVAAQRLEDVVQFVDGGIWQENHGDHLHDYKRASGLAGWRLTGSRPTHYDVQAGVQAAVFMDGDAGATPAVNGSVRVITDASIAAGSTVASLDLPIAVHGLGEPVDDKLLVAARAPDAADALPTHLDLYRRSAGTYVFDRQLPTRCNGMHGSASSGGHTVAGCADGMLLVTHSSATTVSEQKVATPLRVSTVAGHPRLAGQFIGIATEGAAPAPVTTRFYALNGTTATVSDFVPEGWATGRVRRAHGFDRSGQRFFVLDDQGTLTVARWQDGAWTNLARVAGAIPAMPAAAPWPAFTANGAKDEVYLTDPVARQLVTVNSLTGAVVSRRDLGFTPAAAAWVGITR